MYIRIFSRFLEIPDNIFLVPALHLNPAHVTTSQEDIFFWLNKLKITDTRYFMILYHNRFYILLCIL